MSLRRRRFDPTPDDDYNPTNYDEKFVIPTGGGAQMQQSGMFGAAPAYTAPVYKTEQPLGFGAALLQTLVVERPGQLLKFVFHSDLSVLIFVFRFAQQI